MIRNFRFPLRALAVLAALVAPSAAPAQAPYPNQTIKFIVPYAPGGLPDTVARGRLHQARCRLRAALERHFDD